MITCNENKNDNRKIDKKTKMTEDKNRLVWLRQK